MSPSISEIIERADALYGAREQLEQVRASVRLLQTATSDDYEIAWRLGRALFFLGQEAKDKEEARAHHAHGVREGVRAVGLQPARVEGHFWLGVNLALLAQLERSLKALRLALRARGEVRRAVLIDPAYHGAGPLRVLARLQQKLPRLLGGSMKHARVNFERAIKLAPTNIVTRLYFAEMLLELGERNRARAELEMILNAPLDHAWAFETIRDRQLAREMLKKAKVKR